MAVLFNCDILCELIVAFVCAIVKPYNCAATVGIASYEDSKMSLRSTYRNVDDLAAVACLKLVSKVEAKVYGIEIK